MQVWREVVTLQERAAGRMSVGGEEQRLIERTDDVRCVDVTR